MKVTITGANSFIGKRLVERLCTMGWDIVLVVRPGHNVDQIPLNCQVLYLSMKEYDRLGTMVGPCDCFVHLAWSGAHGNARMDRELQNMNAVYSLKAIQSMLAVGCGRVITAGSQAEYGPHTGQVSEEIICRPNTEYGKAKLHFYEDTVSLCVKNGVCYKEPRFFSLYGPGDFAGTMVISILKDMLVNRPCRLTRGIQMWDFLYIDDAVEALAQLCWKSCPNGVYNFGSGDVRQLKDYVFEMAQLTLTKSDLQFGVVPYPMTGMVSLWPDISKLKRELGWEPQVTFAEGIRTIINAMDRTDT